uniref:Uncharacterized protein n=1 Tax=Salix viminalis TaxID=40686 RepID=A0A6N2MUY0_SALVM
MWHISIPCEFSTLRPPEWRLIPIRRRHTTLQNLMAFGAVPLPVYKSIPIEFQRALSILARGVLTVFRVAWREVMCTLRQRSRVRSKVACLKVQRRGVGEREGRREIEGKASSDE